MIPISAGPSRGRPLEGKGEANGASILRASWCRGRSDRADGRGGGAPRGADTAYRGEGAKDLDSFADAGRPARPAALLDQRHIYSVGTPQGTGNQRVLHRGRSACR